MFLRSLKVKGHHFVYKLPIKKDVPVATLVNTILPWIICNRGKQHGQNIMKRPIMHIWDSSLVLMQSIIFDLCSISLQQLLRQYFHTVTEKRKEHADTSNPHLISEPHYEKCQRPLQKTVSDVLNMFVLMCYFLLKLYSCFENKYLCDCFLVPPNTIILPWKSLSSWHRLLLSKNFMKLY